MFTKLLLKKHSRNNDETKNEIEGVSLPNFKTYQDLPGGVIDKEPAKQC